MRGILRHCNYPNLEHLELEYHQDDEEDDLIRELVYAFPNLRSLKLLRYRQSHAENLDVVSYITLYYVTILTSASQK